MIDTITLLLRSGMYTLFAKSKFMLSTSRKGITKHVLNPTRTDRKNGIYRPYLTLNHRANKEGIIIESLTIQISLPKMMFGNNFDELYENDFPEVIQKLKRQLQIMDVGVFESNLAMAEVIGIHYGKNFALRDGTTPKMTIDKVAQGDYFKHLDVEKATYRNDGLSWKLHTNRHELIFYDKKADLLRVKISEGRSEENDNYVQLNLFEEPKKFRPFEVLRMEARLGNKSTIKQVFEQANIAVDRTFKAMFSESVTKQVLLHYLNYVEDTRPKYLDYRSINHSDLLAEIVLNTPKSSPSSLLAYAYLKEKMDQGKTLGSIRQIVALQHDRQWRMLMKQVKAIDVTKREHPFVLMRSQIEQYKPLKLVDFQDHMLNNDKYEH